MAVRTKGKTSIQHTYLLVKGNAHRKSFASFSPEMISTVAELRNSLAHARKDSLWISYSPDLTRALLQNVSSAVQSLGDAVFVHEMPPQSLPGVANFFKKFSFQTNGTFLPADELAEALKSGHRSELFIGGSVDHDSRTITLWRGDLKSLTVPYSAFETSGDGIEPDFRQFSVADCGQTVRLGAYEAATDAILYEFDPEYRRRVSKQRQQSEQSFGASLRRLRKQRGLRREDFSPQVAAKTIARIERGEVQRIQKKTRAALAKRLRVKPDEIASF